MKDSIKAKRLEISGVVQGVGFRPFLFQLSGKYGFKGRVLNTSQGVTLVIEGREEDMKRFCRDIYEKSPPLACVVNIKSESIPLRNYKNFTIVESTDKNRTKSALIPPDVSVCRDCLNEMQSPGNRRFEYPFINCTNCGPRYTIIKDIPYDRPKTSMAEFKMCPQCSREYNDPDNRRFHAQPNACPVCGPHAFLVNKKNEPAALNGKSPVRAAAELLARGRIVAVKGLGGFHLAADAFNDDAVKKLRLFKNRPHKPFGLMADSVETALDYVLISNDEKIMLESAARPIVLLEKRRSTNNSGLKKLPDELAPLNRYLGIMLPYTPLHYLLFEQKSGILVMTSGNPAGEPLCIDNKCALEALKDTADYFLLHNRDIYFRADDSIVCFQNNAPRFLRRSRGYAPLPVFLKKSMPQILACGGGLKSTICLTKGNRAFLSQHIGDLDNKEIFEFYKKSIKHLKNILDISPDIIVHDLHPGYMSTSYAEGLKNIKKIGVQHHHAHAVSCMAENNLSGQVIAITLDGTGLGTDGKIWGGEVLLCSETSFTRMAHLAYVPMPGSESAVLEPWRMGASYLYKAFGKEFVNLDIPFVKSCGKDKLEFISAMMEKNINSPMTSSCGRLFDAVSAILGIREKISFESQAAMELETVSVQSYMAAIKDPEKELCTRNISGEYGTQESTGEKSYSFILKVNGDFVLKYDDKDKGTGKKRSVPDDRKKKLREKPYANFKQDEIFTMDDVLEIDMNPCIRGIVEDLKADRSVSFTGKKFHNTVVSAFTDAALQISGITGIKRAVLSGGVFNNSIILEGICSGLAKGGVTVYTHTIVPAGDGGISLGQAVIAGAKAGYGTEKEYGAGKMTEMDKGEE